MNTSSNPISRRAFVTGSTAAAGLVAAATGIVSSSARAQTIPQSPAGMINVLDFGADNTGSSDTTVAILNARDAAQANGDELCFPPGSYKVNSDNTKGPIKLEGTPINLRGAGRSSHVFNNTGRDVFHLGSTSGNYHDWSLKEMSITAAGGGHALVFFYIGDCLLEKLRLRAVGFGSCVYAHADLGSAAYGMTMRRCVIVGTSNDGAPLINIQCSAGYFSDNTLEQLTIYAEGNTNNDGIVIHGKPFQSYNYNNRIKDVYFQSVTGHCVSLEAAQNFSIENCFNYDLHIYQPKKDLYRLARSADHAYTLYGTLSNVSRGPATMPDGVYDIRFEAASEITLMNCHLPGTGKIDFNNSKAVVIGSTGTTYENDANVTYVA